METFSNKEITAMTMKYNGDRYPVIAKQIGVSIHTINSWFYSDGKLYEPYKEFVKQLEKRRQDKMLENFAETDKNILLATSLVMQGLMKRFNAKDVASGNAKKINPGVGDYKLAWEIQRVMQGLPTDVKNQNMNFDHEKIDLEIAKFNKLFDDDNKDDKTKESDKND